MTLGSLFDGSGGFPLAGAMHGITPVWASEIEPYPIAVSHYHFPDMLHLGDVAEVDGSQIPPVDIVTFGSPCQDMSIAGARKGMKHTEHGADDTTRSGLFYEAIRIMKEMREATNGKYPAYAVWENVPGAFSSSKGEDFRCVLEQLAKIGDPEVSVPLPAKGKWLPAGEVMGDGYSIAWRVLDAQYWGVPQRRKRIYLVASFGNERAGEILFEREGVSWNYPAGRTPREESSDNAADCLAYAMQRFGEYKQSDVVSAQLSRQYKDATDLIFCPETARTLTARNDGSPCLDRGPDFVAFMNRGQAGGETAETLRAESHGAIPMIWAAGFKGGQSEKARSIGYAVEQAPTLSADGSFLDPTVFCIQGNCIDRADTAGCNGKGWREDQSYTLNTIDRPAVVYDARGDGDGSCCPTLTGDHENRVTDYTAICIGNGQLHQTELGNKTGALNCMHDQQAIIHTAHPPRKYIVRRLTPLECNRLQGFPDGWGELPEITSTASLTVSFWEGVRRTFALTMGKKYTPFKNEVAAIKWYNKLRTDTAEYKMWGNGIALPCASFVISRIMEVNNTHG